MNFKYTKTPEDYAAFFFAEKELTYKLRKAIAYQTVALTIPMLNVRIDAAGLSVVNAGPRTSRDEDAIRGTPADPAISSLILACTEAAKVWLASANDYILKNATALGYTIVVVATESNRPNEEFRITFGMF